MNRTIIPVRYIVVMGTFLLSLLLYIDRVCISVAKEPIQNSLALTNTQMGWVLSVFALGYALFQTPSGILADRYGPRIVLSTIVAVWSAFTALTGAAWNFISLLFIRLFFGAGEAGAFPGMARATFNWMPLSERGLVTGINFSGSRLGAAFALPLVAWMINEFGWRDSFYILGVVGLVWAVIWFVLFRDSPERQPYISTTEKDYILKNRQKSERQKEGEKLDLRVMLHSRNMQLAMLQYFCSNFTFFFALTWLFPHVKETYQLDAVEAGLYTSAPLVFGALGNWFSGWLVDYLYKKGDWNLSRRLPAMVGFSLAAMGLVGSIFMTEVTGAIVFLSMAIFGADMSLAPSWAVCVDIGKKHAGAVSGTMNMAGNIGSFLTGLAFPYLRAWSGSVLPFFLVGAALNILAVVFWRYIKANKSLDEY